MNWKNFIKIILIVDYYTHKHLLFKQMLNKNKKINFLFL